MSDVVTPVLKRHLLSIDDLTREQAILILDTADELFRYRVNISDSIEEWEMIEVPISMYGVASVRRRKDSILVLFTGGGNQVITSQMLNSS